MQFIEVYRYVSIRESKHRAGAAEFDAICTFLKRLETDKCITYDIVKRKRVVLDGRRSSSNCGRASTNGKNSFAKCLVELKGSNLL